MKIKILPTLLFVLIQTIVFSQSTGDFRSKGSGPWTSLTSWEYFNGTTWGEPNAFQGYPGLYETTAGAVLISYGHTITIGSMGITTKPLGTITISGTLQLTGLSASDVNFTFTTLNVIVTPGLTPVPASIAMVDKVKFIMPVLNAVLQVNANGINSGGACSANQSFVIGNGTANTTSSINCVGPTSFVDLATAGGTPNAIPSINTNPICQAYPINLVGAFSGYGSSSVVYLWTIVDPNNNIVTPSGTAKDPIITNPIAGTYKATLKCTVTYSGTYTNSETINIVVNPTPLVPIIGAVKPIDCNSLGSVVLSGLPTGNWVINPGNISGSGASTTINGLAVGSYSFTVTNQFGCVSLATLLGSIQITDKASSTWNGAWSNGIPSITTNVILAANYSTTSQPNITACSITINSGLTVSVTDGKFFTIQNNLSVATAATLNISNQGSLVMVSDSGTVTNNGTMNLNKTTTPFEKFDYTYWTSPITTTAISYTAGTTFANWRSDRAYYFNPANFLDLDNDGFDDDQNDWMGATNMDVPGLGYIIMGPTWLSSYPATESVVFKAVGLTNKFNTGIINVPIALTPGAATDDDWNLIGNPYPCAIDANKFINANSSKIDATLYFWTHKADIGGGANLGPDARNFAQSDYAMYNLSGGIGTSATVSTTGSNNAAVNSIPLGYIASCQGFFVEAAVNGNITFNNSMRVGDAITDPNKQFYKTLPVKDDTKVKDRIWLNLENDLGMFSQQLLGYFDNTTNDFDNGYDGLLSDGGNYINFYSLIGESKYKIQGREAFKKEDQVRLGFFSAIGGVFNINIDSKEGVFNTKGKKVFITDKLTGITHDLNDSPYSFSTEKGTFNDRFELSYSAKTLGVEDVEQQNNNVFVSVKNKQIKISSASELIDKVEVFDLLGRLVYEKNKIDSNEFSVINLVSNKQMLLIKTVLQKGQTVTDKIIY